MVDFEQGYISWVYSKNTKEKFIYFNPSRLDPGQKEKNNLIALSFSPSFFHRLHLIKALKAFIKPFKAPQRSVNVKIFVNFYFTTTF